MPELLVLLSLDLLPRQNEIWGNVERTQNAAAVPAFPLSPWVPISASVRREGEPSGNFLVSLLDPADNRLLAVFTTATPATQWFDRQSIYREVLAQAYDYSEPRLGMSRWPTLSETANSLLFNITEGSENQVSTVPATVDLLAAVDSVRSIRHAVIVERMDDGQWRVAGYGESRRDSVVALDLKVTPSGQYYALGIDDYGVEFVPGLRVTVGQRIRPSRFAGWLYEIMEPGVLPSTEPQWWPIEGENPSRPVGTARAIAVRYYLPLALGPVTVEML